jgi:hypothetical protein
MLKLSALQAEAQRHAFAAVVNGSWRARQDFRDVMHAVDRLSDEAELLAA